MKAFLMRLWGRIKGWRTRALAALVVVIGALELYAPGMWAALLPKEYQGIATIGIGVAIYILRQITTTPPGKAD
jgi:hypothetical protein